MNLKAVTIGLGYVRKPIIAGTYLVNVSVSFKGYVLNTVCVKFLNLDFNQFFKNEKIVYNLSEYVVKSNNHL